MLLNAFHCPHRTTSKIVSLIRQCFMKPVPVAVLSRRKPGRRAEQMNFSVREWGSFWILQSQALASLFPPEMAPRLSAGTWVGLVLMLLLRCHYFMAAENSALV